MKKLAIGIGALAVVVLAVLLFTGGKSDEQKIQQALDDSIKASREGRPGGVLEYLSSSITFNGESPASNAEIGKYIKKMKPDITVMDRDVVIAGDTATIVTPVKLEMSAGPISYESPAIPNVTITFRKEMGVRYGVVPTSKWKVSSVEAPQFDFNMSLPGIE